MCAWMQKESPPFRFSFTHLEGVGVGARLQLGRRGWRLQGTPPPSHPGRPEPPPQQLARARQRSRPGAARGTRGARGGEGAARVGAGAETSCPASGLGPAFDPRSPAAPLQAAPREPLPRPQLAPFSPTHRAERSTRAGGRPAWRCPGGVGWPTKGLNTSAW